MAKRSSRRVSLTLKLPASLLAALAMLLGLQGGTRPTTALAVSGTPTPTSFGYGISLDANSPQAIPAIPSAAGAGLDWLAIEFDWAARWPDPNTPPDLSALSAAIEQARLSHMNVMLSIRNAPSWARAATGPDPVITANLTLSLANFYPDTLLAIELFPAANTAHGWGAPPDPLAYTTLLQTAANTLQANQRPILLIAAGLTPPAAPEDMDDLAFLDGLYRSGAAAVMPIVSMRLPGLNGDPLSASTPENRNVLRHYEDIRQVMLNHEHRQGLIWLTGFSWPAVLNDPEAQSLWVSQAYQLLVAQLYIGAAFFQQLTASADLAHPYLVNPDLSQHPALQRLSSVVRATGSQPISTSAPARLKRIANRPDFKPNTP